MRRRPLETYASLINAASLAGPNIRLGVMGSPRPLKTLSPPRLLLALPRRLPSARGLTSDTGPAPLTFVFKIGPTCPVAYDIRPLGPLARPWPKRRLLDPLPDAWLMAAKGRNGRPDSFCLSHYYSCPDRPDSKFDFVTAYGPLHDLTFRLLSSLSCVTSKFLPIFRYFFATTC